MAFPTIPTTGSGDLLSSTTSTASTTHTFPNLSSLRGGAGPQSGDLIIAICVQYSGTSGGSPNDQFSSWGASLTETRDDETTTANDLALGVAHKVATGSESGTFTVTSAFAARSVNFLMRIPAGTWHGTTIPEVVAAVRATGAVANAASLDPAGWGTEDTLWITVYGHSETTTTGSPPTIDNPPTNYSGQLIVARAGDAVGHITAGVAFYQQNEAAEDAGTWTVTNALRGNGLATTIAVRPKVVTVKNLTPALENESAQSLSITKTIYKSISPVLESDDAQALSRNTGILARRFDGSDDKLDCAIGGNDLTGAFSMAALIRCLPGGQQSSHLISVHRSTGGSANLYWFTDYTTSPQFKLSLTIAGTTRTTPNIYAPEGEWVIVGVSKAADTATPRAHIYTAGGGWSHEDLNGTLGNPATCAGGTVDFGHFGTFAFYRNDFAVVAEWDSALSDSDFASLNADPESQNFDDLNPVAGWNFDQASVATPVTDWTGGGADQSSITGTTVNNDGPPSWDYAVVRNVNLTPALENESAQSLSITKTIYKSISPVLESDDAQVLSKTQAIYKTLTAVLESDQAQTPSVTKTIYKNLTAVLESDQPQTLSVTKTIYKSITAVLESDQASTLARTTHKTLTAALESDTAQALSITHIHYRTLEPVAEADQALSVSYTQAHTYAIIEALESDAAQTLSVTKTIYKSLVPVSEADTPQTLSAKHFRTLTSASEADAPQALSYVKPIHQSITAVPESETAEILSVEKPIHKSLTAALESSAAQALSFLKTIHKTLTAVPELDLAQALSIIHPIRRSLTPVDETDTAQDLYFTQENIFYILPVEEVEEALALNRIQILRPDSDSVDGEWTNEIGGTELASHVSDQDYGTYIQSPASPSADACRLKLKSGLAPVEGARLLKFRVWRDQPGQTIDLIVSLREGGGDNLGGGTLVNQFTHQNITDAATVEDEVTGNITDYSNLYVELEASEV